MRGSEEAFQIFHLRLKWIKSLISSSENTIMKDSAIFVLAHCPAYHLHQSYMSYMDNSTSYCLNHRPVLLDWSLSRAANFRGSQVASSPVTPNVILKAISIRGSSSNNHREITSNALHYILQSEKQPWSLLLRERISQVEKGDNYEFFM